MPEATRPTGWRKSRPMGLRRSFRGASSWLEGELGQGGCVMNVPRLAVYDGQTLLGEVEDRGRHTVLAFRFDGVRRIKVGVFPDRRTAMRAVVTSKDALAGANA
jgi:hypothetical protein